MTDAAAKSPSAPPPGRSSRRRRLLEWVAVLVVVTIVFSILGYLTFNETRADRNGFLSGIGWRPLQSALLTMLVFALFTLGLSLQFGFTGLINFGHVAFLAIGAYTAAILTWGQGTFFGRTIGWGSKIYRAPFWEALGYAAVIILVAAVVAVLFALVLGIPTLKLREDYLAIVTIGSAEILRIFLLNQDQLTNGPVGLNVRVPANTWVLDRTGGWAESVRDFNDRWNTNIDAYYAFIIILVVLAFVFFYVLLQRLARAPWGRVVRAIREDEDAAASLGKNVYLYKMTSLVIGSVIAAVAGVLYAWFYRSVSPDSFLPIITFYAWIILVVGGVGNHKGVIVGSVILWGIFEISRNVDNLPIEGLEDAAGPPRMVLVGVLLIVVMMFRPQGIMGRREELLFAK